ncbi:MAG: RlmE family RNA methyltransferase [Gammaproteobacteria bacterium]|nr:RlmE family RNA methyltransferase [Gammaproteobacteria bacterium]
MKIQSKSKKINKAWLQEHIQDPYVKRAQQEGYRSRAAYKLIQIDEQFKLLHANQSIVDLGCAPGAWSQYISRKQKAFRANSVSPQNFLVGIDLLPCEKIHEMQFVLGDFREPEVQQHLVELLPNHTTHLIVSDIAPNFSGIAQVDAWRMEDLLSLTLEFSKQCLHINGKLLCKAFHGTGFSQTISQYKKVFAKVKEIKPLASRSKSAEVYLLCSERK